MRRKSQLSHLCVIEKHKYNKTLLQLKAKISECTNQEQKLEILKKYFQEYHVSPSGNTVAVGPFLQRHSFLENLKLTIQEQNKAVILAKQAVQQAQIAVDEAYKSLRGIERLLEKQAAIEQKEQHEKEMNELDEQLIIQYNRKQKKGSPFN